MKTAEQAWREHGVDDDMPVPEHFQYGFDAGVDATLPGLAALIHYPEHWCTTAYPTLASALAEILKSSFNCSVCADPEAHQ